MPKSPLDQAFETHYKRLNKAQKEAVDAIEGPVMVIAGPGTGKTTILTLRIANMLKKTDTPANGILAITYTDSGVKAMRQKLQEVIGNRAYDVRIHTFHGFATSIIAEYPDHFLHISDMKQMTDIEQELLIREILSVPTFAPLRPAAKPDAYISGIIRGIDDAKHDAITPEMVRAYANEQMNFIKTDESSLSTRGATKGQLKAEAKEAIAKCEKTLLFADIYEQYETKKKEAKQMDFNDLIIELLLALRTDELLLRLIQERYLYIHVDEHQDTNDSQNLIIRLVAEFFETPNIFIVGDEKQAIYRFQGASVENFLLLQKYWPGMNLIRLDTNYRSHQGILDASFAMIQKNYEGDEHKELRIALRSGSKDKPQKIDMVTGENVSAIEKYLVQELKKLPADATAAIIVRRNRDLDRIIRLLELHNVPVSSERSVDIFSHPIGRIFFDLAEYISDPSKLEALAKTIVSGMWNLSFEQGIVLVRELRSGIENDIDKKLPALVQIRKKALSDGAIGFLVHAAEESGFIILVAHDPSYIHVWRGIITLAESLAREGDLTDPLLLIQKMLAYRQSAESRTVKVSVGAPDVPIQAMTAHGSKGLEFDYVFIPYATEEAWIGKARGASFVLPKKQTSYSDISDTRRLFYVALTRARKHAVILTAMEEADGKQLSPLRFISELDPKYLAETLLPRVGSEIIATKTRSSDQTNLQSSPLVDIVKQTLLKKGLSPTALNHFLECPNKFMYQSILKLPQAPSVSAEKGTAMHEALASVWDSVIKNKTIKAKEIEAILSEKISDYFKESFLSMIEKKAAQKELTDDIPQVAKALEPHFSLGSKNTGIFTELWMETKTPTKYGGKFIDIPLHGKLDALLDTGNEVSIFDYKTKQAMSVAAIKGETKSDDGNYFRQLIFYKLLASDDMRFRGRRITPALVFVSPDDKGRCPTISLPIEEKDIQNLKNEVQTLVDSVWSGEIAQAKRTDEKCEWCGLRSISGV